MSQEKGNNLNIQATKKCLIDTDVTIKKPKKKFVKPEIKRHDSLPEVTTGFFGSVSP